MSIKNVTINNFGDVISTPFMTSSSKDLIKIGCKGEIENFSKRLWKYSWARTRDYTMAVIMITVVVAASKAKNITISAKKRDGNSDMLLSEYINKKVKKSKISDLFKKIINIEKSSDSNNIADSISKENKPHGWFAKCFISLLLASKNDENGAKSVFGDFLKQVRKMTKWKINKSYMQGLVNVVNNALSLDIASWKNRYDNMEENKELSYKDYRKFYVSRASDGRNLHAIKFDQLKPDETRNLDKKFTTSVMERRYAHLQQVKYVMEYFIKKTNNNKLVKSAIYKEILELEKSLNDARKKGSSFKELFENEEKANEAISKEIEGPLKELKSLYDNFSLARLNKQPLLDLYKLIDDLLKILLRYPDEIPNLKLSSNVTSKIDDYLKSYRSDKRGTRYIQDTKSEKSDRFMLTSDEKTDRTLAMLENYAYDGDNGHHQIEEFCAYITSIPIGLAHMEEFYIKKLPASKSLPNPYRRKHGVY